MPKDLMKDVLKPIKNASPEVQQIVSRVLEAERQKLYLEQPHLVQDIVNIIKEEVK